MRLREWLIDTWESLLCSPKQPTASKQLAQEAKRQWQEARRERMHAKSTRLRAVKRGPRSEGPG